jgi:hypothetical protein
VRESRMVKSGGVCGAGEAKSQMGESRMAGRSGGIYGAFEGDDQWVEDGRAP